MCKEKNNYLIMNCPVTFREKNLKNWNKKWACRSTVFSI